MIGLQIYTHSGSARKSHAHCRYAGVRAVVSVLAGVISPSSAGMRAVASEPQLKMGRWCKASETRSTMSYISHFSLPMSWYVWQCALLLRAPLAEAAAKPFPHALTAYAWMLSQVGGQMIRTGRLRTKEPATCSTSTTPSRVSPAPGQATAKLRGDTLLATYHTGTACHQRSCQVKTSMGRALPTMLRGYLLGR